ncbi:P-selectin-like [Branchiostoma floridae x Branchiostoma japonicum]
MRSNLWISAIFVLVLFETIDGGRCPRRFRRRGCRALTLPNTIRSNCQAPFRCGDECRYECVPGCVKRTGARVRVCRFGRYWRGGRGLKCSCRPCGSPPDVRDAGVSGCTAPFTAGTTCSYQCNPGFRNVGGSETRMCVDGRWEGSTLNCAAIPCPTLTGPAFGSLTPPGPHSYPIRVTFTCNTGYVRNGASSTVCQADGTWSDPVPTCTPVQCQLFWAPLHGTLNPVGTNSYQTVVRFTCNTGYVLNGAADTTCQADGTWSNAVPTCTPVQCPTLTAPANGVLIPIGATSYQVRVMFICNPGYHLNGASSATCRADGTWSNSAPTCTLRACPTLTPPTNGTLSPPGPAYSYPTQVTITCNSGYQLNGVSPVTCQANGQWSNPVPTCTPRQCPGLTAPTNGALSPSGSAYSYPTQVTVTCNSGYQLNGASSVTCQADGTWSDPVPTCTPPK